MQRWSFACRMQQRQFLLVSRIMGGYGTNKLNGGLGKYNLQSGAHLVDMVLGQAALLHQLCSWAPSHAPPWLKIGASTEHTLAMQGHPSARKTGLWKCAFACATWKSQFGASHNRSGRQACRGAASELWDPLTDHQGCLSTCQIAIWAAILISSVTAVDPRPQNNTMNPDGVNMCKYK